MMLLIFLVCLYINYKLGPEGFVNNSDISMVAVIIFSVVGIIMLLLVVGLNISIK